MGIPEEVAMRFECQAILINALVVGASLISGLPSTYAQGTGSGRSLGGYGSMATSSGVPMGGGPSAGMGGSTVAAFAGRFGAEMPSGGSGSGGIAFRSNPSAASSSTRASFTISPMGSGMSGIMGSGRRAFVLKDFGSAGRFGLGGGMRRQLPGAASMDVMPPNFGSPFRQPPTQQPNSTAGAGMSM